MGTESSTHSSTGSSTDWVDAALLSLNIPRERRTESRTSADYRALQNALEQDANKCRETVYHRPILVVLSGLPGTGKSFFARALADRVSILVLESDRLRKVLFSEPGYSSVEDVRLFPTIHRLILEYLFEGLSVVFDSCNLRESDRQDAYRIADNLGVPMVPVLCSAHPTVVHRRLKKRGTETALDVYSDADWQVYCKLFPSQEHIAREHLAVDSVNTLSRAVGHIVPLVSAVGRRWEVPSSAPSLTIDTLGMPSGALGQVPDFQHIPEVGEADESVDEFPIGSVHEFIEVLQLQGVQLGVSPMFSPEGKPVSLAGYVAVTLGWQLHADGMQDYATGGLGPRQVLTEAFKLNPRELASLQRAESGETYKDTRTVLGRLEIFCRNNEWTHDDRPAKHTRLEQGGKSHHSVRIWHKDPSDQLTERIVDTYGIGNGYVDALDHLTNTPMLFKIADIQRVQATGDGYIVPESYTPSEWLEEYKERYGPPYVQPEPVKQELVKPPRVKPTPRSPVHVPGPTYDDSDTIETRWSRLSRSERLRLAAEHRRSVEIGYVASERYGDSEQTKRIVDIYVVGNTYLDAYCHLRNGMRRFKISRIQTVDITGLTFVKPDVYPKPGRRTRVRSKSKR